MGDVETYNPKTLTEALELLAQAPETTAVLAGGTDLLVRLQNRKTWPERIVHIGFIEELRGVQAGKEIRIGALTTHSELVRLHGQGGWGDLLAASAREIGSVQIRNRGTLGGNLVNASPAGDLIPALSVLEARLVLRSVRGTRDVPVGDFFTAPGQTLRAADELLTQVIFPRPAEEETGVFIKLGQRRAQAISKVMLALWCGSKGKTLRNVRIALGAVAPTVVRCPRTEALLTAESLAPELIARAARMVEQEVRPIGDIRSTEGYRRRMCGALLTQALETLPE